MEQHGQRCPQRGTNNVDVALRRCRRKNARHVPCGRRHGSQHRSISSRDHPDYNQTRHWRCKVLCSPCGRLVRHMARRRSGCCDAEPAFGFFPSLKRRTTDHVQKQHPEHARRIFNEVTLICSPARWAFSSPSSQGLRGAPGVRKYPALPRTLTNGVGLGSVLGRDVSARGTIEPSGPRGVAP